MPTGKATSYAIYQFEDGAFLLLSMLEATAWSMLINNHALIVFVLVFGLCMVLFLVVLLDVLRREKRVDQVMRTLDRFSEGNFDVRIEGFSNKDAGMAEYNAIISRIQERIFRQRNRNHVLSTVMSQMQNGIITVDADLRVIFVTPVAKKLLGSWEMRKISISMRHRKMSNLMMCLRKPCVRRVSIPTK